MKRSNLVMVILVSLLMLMGCSKQEKTGAFMVMAHRGGAGLAPENTMAALKNAMKLGVPFSEIDVQETSDGKIIILHDNTLERTGGKNWNIWETPYDSLVKLDLGSWFAPEFRGEKIMTLEEAIDAVFGKMSLNIELKRNKHEIALVEKVLNILKEKKFEDKCVLTSFYTGFIEQVKTLNPNLTVGLIFSKYPKDFDVFTYDVDLLSVKHTLVDEAFVKKAHENGKKVFVWTVNEPEMMTQLLSLGVDGIITDYPDRLLDVLKSQN